jgi:hypothetical protein
MEIVKTKDEISFGINFVEKDIATKMESGALNGEQFRDYISKVESAELAMNEVDTLSLRTLIDNGYALQRLANKCRRYSLLMTMLKDVAKYYREEYIRRTQTAIVTGDKIESTTPS